MAFREPRRDIPSAEPHRCTKSIVMLVAAEAQPCWGARSDPIGSSIVYMSREGVAAEQLAILLFDRGANVLSGMMKRLENLNDVLAPTTWLLAQALRVPKGTQMRQRASQPLHISLPTR